LEESVLLQALTEEIASIKATLDQAKAEGQSLNEAQTEFVIIDPLLKRLGYGPLEISKQGHDSIAKSFPDYTLLAGKPQKWFLEAKKLDLNLQDGEAAQAVNYANNQGAEWAVLTNGRKWYIYNAHLKKPLPEKRVLQINDLFAEDNAAEILLLLSKPSILSNDLQEAWLFQQLTLLIDEQLKTPNSEVREIIRKLGSEATKFSLTDDIVGRALLFATPNIPAQAVVIVKDNSTTPSQDDSDVPKATNTTALPLEDEQHTFDEIAKDITLATYRKPKAITFGTTTEQVKTWADVAQIVVGYVGTVSPLPLLPYNAGTKGKNYFLNSTAFHANGKKMQHHRVVQVGLAGVFIDTNRSTLNICACLMALLRATGVPLSAIKISIA